MKRKFATTLIALFVLLTLTASTIYGPQASQPSSAAACCGGPACRECADCLSKNRGNPCNCAAICELANQQGCEMPIPDCP